MAGAGVREFKRRIRSVKNTQQITKAMKMVAAAKLRRAQESAEASRPYTETLQGTLARLTAVAYDVTHPLLEKCGPPPEGEHWTPRFRQAAALAAEGRLPELVFNRLERPVFHDHPALAEIKGTLLALGAHAAAMSGSGSVLFGLFRQGDPVADAVAALKRSFPEVTAHLCRFSPETTA